MDIFKDLNNKVEVPSHSIVSWHVKEMFDMSCKQVVAMLKVHTLVSSMGHCLMYSWAHPGKLHICADGWTSPNVISFVGLTLHWVGEGQIQSTILDFVKYILFILSQLCVHSSKGAHGNLPGNLNI